MSRVTLAALLLLVVCGLALVTSQHRARKHFIELESQQALAKKLDDEHAQLKIEQGTWAAPRRVGDIATRQLGMRMPAPSNTVLIQSPDGASLPNAPQATSKNSKAATAVANTPVVAVRP
jgi:cell division protein FtsL